MEHNCTLPNPTGPAGLPPVARRARFVGAGFPRGQLCTVGRAPGARRQLPPRATAPGRGPASHAQQFPFQAGFARSAPSLRAVGAWAVARWRAQGMHSPARAAGRAGPRWRGLVFFLVLG